jgi:hypothetical protein
LLEDEMTAMREYCPAAWIVLAAVLSGACSEGEYDPLEEATGSAMPQGGSAGAPAASAAGGAAGSAGASVGSGGAAGSATVSGGSAGSGSTAPTETIAFAADLDGFRINYYCSGNPPACAQVMDVAPAPAENGADAGAPQPAPDNDFVEAAFDATVGEPDPGSARVTLQFSVDGQLADLARNFGTDMTPGLNLTGKVITARARVEAGGAPTVVAKMYVKTGMTYSYADSGETPLVPGVWATLRYQTPTYVNDTAAYNVGDVREIGIEILGRGATAPTATVVHVDTIQY